MPNWSNNTIKIKAEKSKMLDFINSVLENKKEDITEAFEEMKANKELSLGTFRPMPKTFEDFDTTNSLDKEFAKNVAKNNNPFFSRIPDYIEELRGCTDEDKIQKAQERYEKEYNEAIEFQKKEYGAVGWYDYNCNVRFGCKWDANIQDITLTKNDKEEYIISFYCDTPWCYPFLWCGYIGKKFKVDVYICAFEESDEYNFYGKFNGSNIINEINMVLPYLTEEDEENDYEEYWNEKNEIMETFLSDFDEYVYSD